MGDQPYLIGNTCASIPRRGDTIRTCDIVLPKHALYQTELHLELGACPGAATPPGYSRPHSLGSLCISKARVSSVPLDSHRLL